MAEIYGHRWTASFGERINQDHAWASVLAGMTGKQIAAGLNHLVTARLAWPPTAPEFLAFCEARPTAESLGLPRVDKAFFEACENSHPSARNNGKWSHQCVYHAATETGFYALNTLKTEESRRIFARNYEIAVRDFVDGKPMKAIPLALPETVHATRTEKAGIDSIKALREMLRGNPNSGGSK